MKMMMNAARATIPTFNCDQRTFPRSGILNPLFHELRYIWISGRFQPVLVTLEDQPAFAQDHKSSPRALPRPVMGSLQTALFRIVAKIRDQIPVLIPMRDHQRGGMPEIALLDKERNDRV